MSNYSDRRVILKEGKLGSLSNEIADSFFMFKFEKEFREDMHDYPDVWQAEKDDKWRQEFFSRAIDFRIKSK